MMIPKKILPYVVLIAAALLLFYVKKKQRGHLPERPKTDVTIPVVANDEINRSPSRIIYSRHARCRMECRYIDESEVKEILQTGVVNASKIHENEKGKTYPLEGITHDKQHVRIVFAPKENDAVEVVTCIDLDNDWPCNCK